MAGVAFAVEGDGVGFATESYAASALCTTLASLSGTLWRIRRANIYSASLEGPYARVASIADLNDIEVLPRPSRNVLTTFKPRPDVLSRPLRVCLSSAIYFRGAGLLFGTCLWSTVVSS
jgi:hypothetical protein